MRLGSVVGTPEGLWVEGFLWEDGGEGLGVKSFLG